MPGQRRHLNVLQSRQPAPALPGHRLQGLLMESLGCMGGCGGCPMKGGCGASPGGKNAGLRSESVPLRALPEATRHQRPDTEKQAERIHDVQPPSEKKKAPLEGPDISRAFSDMILSSELILERRRISASETGHAPIAREGRAPVTEEPQAPIGARPKEAAPSSPAIEPAQMLMKSEPAGTAMQIEGPGPAPQGRRREEAAVPRARLTPPWWNAPGEGASESMPVQCMVAVASINRAALKNELASTAPEIVPSPLLPLGMAPASRAKKAVPEEIPAAGPSGCPHAAPLAHDKKRKRTELSGQAHAPDIRLSSAGKPSIDPAPAQARHRTGSQRRDAIERLPAPACRKEDIRPNIQRRHLESRVKAHPALQASGIQESSRGRPRPLDAKRHPPRVKDIALLFSILSIFQKRRKPRKSRMA